MEGEQQGHWVLIDYNDVVIHLFYQPVREFYDLEGLWVEAPRVNMDRDSRDRDRVT
jgi:ribosome-associated protein